MTISLCYIDWTAISAIVTGLMTIFTLVAVVIALRSNKIANNAVEEAKESNSMAERAIQAALEANAIAQTTFEEMVYQREQQERPYVAVGLDVNFEISKVLFTMTNYGNRPADKVSVKFDDAFLNAVGQPSNDSVSTIKTKEFRDALDKLSESEFNLAPQQSRKIYFADLGGDAIRRNADVIITCEYQWMKNNGEIVTDSNKMSINLSNYHWVSEIWKNKGNQPIDKIVKTLNQIANTLKQFQRMPEKIE